MLQGRPRKRGRLFLPWLRRQAQGPCCTDTGFACVWGVPVGYRPPRGDPWWITWRAKTRTHVRDRVALRRPRQILAARDPGRLRVGYRRRQGSPPGPPRARWRDVAADRRERAGMRSAPACGQRGIPRAFVAGTLRSTGVARMAAPGEELIGDRFAGLRGRHSGAAPGQQRWRAALAAPGWCGERLHHVAAGCAWRASQYSLRTPISPLAMTGALVFCASKEARQGAGRAS